MTDTSGTGGQEPNGTNGAGQGQEPPANGQPGQEPDGGQQQAGATAANAIDPTTIEDPNLRAYVEKVQADAKEAREQAARYRTERNTVQTQFTEFQQQHETAEQKADRERQERDQQAQAERERITALEQENRDLKIGGAIRTAATDAKAFNPDLVANMLRDKVSLDDTGKPTNLQDLLKDLRTSDPYLFKRGANQDAGAGNDGEGTPPAGTMNDAIRQQVAARRGGRTT